MTTPPDKCLAHLETLVDNPDGNSLIMAESFIEELLQNSLKTREDAAAVLGDLQNQFLRRTAPSPLRADIFDLLGDHILRLLDAQGA